jgi:hypothetical protein
MDPGNLFSNAHKFKEVRVQPRLLHGLFEQGFMGSGRAGSDHHAVEPVEGDRLFDLRKIIDGAGPLAFLGEGHVFEPTSVLNDLRYGHGTGDIGASVTDKDTHSNLFVHAILVLQVKRAFIAAPQA